VPSKQPEGERCPEFLPPRFPRGAAPSAARTVGRNAALLLWPLRATYANTTASQACRPPHRRMNSPLPRRKPAFSPPPGLLRSPQQGKTAGLRAGWFQFSPGSRFAQAPFACPMVTKPKALWPMEAPRGFAPAFWRVGQAAASTVASARRSTRGWKATPR